SFRSVLLCCLNVSMILFTFRSKNNFFDNSSSDTPSENKIKFILGKSFPPTTLKGLLYPARHPLHAMLRSYFFPSITVITPIFPIDEKEYVLDGKCNFKIPKTTPRLPIDSLLHFSTSSSTVASTFCLI